MSFAFEICQAALNATYLNVGAMYGTAERLAPGAGVIYSGLTYPMFNPETGRFRAQRGAALILTHECDIDQANDREFNQEFIFLPLMKVEAFAQMFDLNHSRRTSGLQLAESIGAGHVTRMSYLPPRAGDELELGAFLYFNAITSSHISQLAGAQPHCALSDHGMSNIDRCLHNHLFRPKADRLPTFLNFR